MRDISFPSPEDMARYQSGLYTPPPSFKALFTEDERQLILRGWAPEGSDLGFGDIKKPERP